MCAHAGRRPFCVWSAVLITKINNRSIYFSLLFYTYMVSCTRLCNFFFVSRPAEKYNVKSSISSKYNNNNGNDDDVDVWSLRKLV